MQVADIGEVAYILSQVSESYSGFDSSNVTNEEYFDSWSLPWFAQGDTNLQAASDDSNGYDNLTRSTLYWKAANYYFTGEHCGSSGLPAINFLLCFRASSSALPCVLLLDACGSSKIM